jgi:hypothetical protein
MTADPVPADLAARIAALPDLEAPRVLALVLEQNQRVLDPLAWRHTQTRLREAVTDPQLQAHFAEPAAPRPTQTELARTALAYLAETHPQLRPLIDRAIHLPPAAPTERLDPATLAIGALVLLALQTEVKLERNPTGKWTFRFHKQPLRESTLGTLLAKLIATYGPPS